MHMCLGCADVRVLVRLRFACCVFVFPQFCGFFVLHSCICVVAVARLAVSFPNEFAFAHLRVALAGFKPVEELWRCDAYSHDSHVRALHLLRLHLCVHALWCLCLRVARFVFPRFGALRLCICVLCHHAFLRCVFEIRRSV
jgi:hypothetical protein